MLTGICISNVPEQRPRANRLRVSVRTAQSIGQRGKSRQHFVEGGGAGCFPQEGDADAIHPRGSDVGLHPGSEVHLYDAGHAFLDDHRPEHHDSEQAALAWAKIEGFLLRNLEG